MNLNYLFATVFLLFFTSCEEKEFLYSDGDFKIEIQTGENWLHDFPLFLGLTKENPPQFAIWIEDTAGNYINTLFVTYKIATEGWISNNGNRRKESLPHWCYKRGIQYSDGLYLPTKDKPITDAISGATPKTNKEIQFRIKDNNKPFVIKAEFNHSVDFNEYYPKDANLDDANYSGGKDGSGQPALVYADTFYYNKQIIQLKLIGHSSADGSDGNLYSNLDKITTAKGIVRNIKLEIIK